MAVEKKLTADGTPAEANEDSLIMSRMPLWARPGYLVRRLHQIHYALFFEECAAFDITPVQYGLLTTLAQNPDMDQNSLGRELGIDRTNVADVLNRLAKRGLVARERSRTDRRMVLCLERGPSPAGSGIRSGIAAFVNETAKRHPGEVRIGALCTDTDEQVCPGDGCRSVTAADFTDAGRAVIFGRL